MRHLLSGIVAVTVGLAGSYGSQAQAGGFGLQEQSDGDRVSLSGGVGFAVSQALSIDLADSHYFVVGERHVRCEPGNPTFVGLPLVAEFSADIDLSTVGLTYRW